MTGRMKKINIAVSAACIALAVFAIREAATFRHTVVGNDYTGPAFFPRLMSAALILLAIVLAAASLSAKTIDPHPVEAGTDKNETTGLFPPVAGLMVLVVYAAVLEPVGFLISTLFLALAFLLLGGVRKWHALLLYPPAFSLAIYYVFRKLLVVFLPEGIFYF